MATRTSNWQNALIRSLASGTGTEMVMSVVGHRLAELDGERMYVTRHYRVTGSPTTLCGYTPTDPMHLVITTIGQVSCMRCRDRMGWIKNVYPTLKEN